MERLCILPIIALIMITGCVATRQLETEQAELISMTALPSMPAGWSAGQLRLNVLFRILHDGTVADVKILGTSGDPEWDAAAIDSMKQWRFVPVQLDSIPPGRWMRVAVVVRTEEPMMMNLALLATSNLKNADSLYVLLQKGISFDTLASHIQLGRTNASVSYLGTVDLARYPAHVRDVLRKLAVSSFSRPIRVGEEYHIYKRFEPDRKMKVVQ